MRKIFKNMAWMLTATLAMAACSDSLDESDNTGQGPLTGEGYVKVAINMPSVSSTRAGDPTFADGDANEYAVKSGIIAFFEGTEEAKATFVKAYDLGNLIQNDIATNGQVSTVVSQIIEAPFKKDATNTMYALVILNSGPTGAKLATVDSSTGNLTLKNGTTDIQFTSGATTTNLYTEWNLDVVTANFPTNGFLMLNAPLYNSTKTQTLVPVTVYASKDAADVATADEIYVERIVGKVNVKITGDATSLEVTGGAYANDKVIFSETGNNKLGWVLNVTNKNTKPLRDVSELSTWIGYTQHQGNFIGTSNVTGNWVRIYWAKDNNYAETSTTIDTNDFTAFDSNGTMPQTWGGYTTAAATNAQYCLENTETSANYRKNNTTSVVIKAKYDINGDGASSDASFFIMDKIANTMDENAFLSAIKANVTNGNSLTLSIVADAKAGYYEGTELRTLISGLNDVSETDLNALGEVRYYKDGECYYSIVPIKHFNEITYTPGEEPVDEKHLGRYGVVRNNWYELTINSVSGPGEPTLEPGGNDPVDEDEGYIKCTINVLSWAKRSQGVEL